MEDYSSWPTIPEVIKRTGLSLRTIERRIAAQDIETRKRPEPGKRPITIINPDHIPKLTAVVLKPVRESAPPTRQDALVPATITSTRQADMTDVLAALAKLRIPLSAKLYLTTQEAAEYTGLSKAEIKRLTKEHVLPSFVAGRRRLIKRKDLERYNPTIRQMEN